jgi:hypothetical protein
VLSSTYSWRALLKFEASYSSSSGFIPSLDFYDVQEPYAGGTAYSSFSGAFYYFDYPPTISDVTNQLTQVSTPVGPLAFTVGDTETPAAALVVTKATDNPALVPASNILLTGGGANRFVTVVPTPGQTGVATITLTVTDGGGATNFDVFTVTFNAPPAISDIPNQFCQRNGSVGPVSFTVGDAETAATNLTLTALSSNPTLVPVANVVFGGRQRHLRPARQRAAAVHGEPAPQSQSGRFRHHHHRAAECHG